MAKKCPEKNGEPALYLECLECETRSCEKSTQDTTISMISEEEQAAKYGVCECGHPLHPVVFIDKCDQGPERGKIHMAVSYLQCSICGRTESVDDTFDQKKWYPDTEEIRRKIYKMCEYYLSRMH